MGIQTCGTKLFCKTLYHQIRKGKLMPDKMWMKKNYNPKNFAGMLLRIKIGRMKLYFVLLMKSHLQSYPCPLQINSIFFFLVVGQQEMSLMNRLCRNSFSSTGIRFHSFLPTPPWFYILLCFLPIQEMTRNSKMHNGDSLSLGVNL